MEASELAALLRAVLACDLDEQDSREAMHELEAMNNSVELIGDTLRVVFGGAAGLCLGAYEITVRKKDRARVDVDDVQTRWCCVVDSSYLANTPGQIEAIMDALDVAGENDCRVWIGEFGKPESSVLTSETVTSTGRRP